jgi:mRNA-degrading endonuclease RelE of RelBE toxin-antitoxin system
MRFRVELTPEAARALVALPADVRRHVLDALDALVEVAERLPPEDSAWLRAAGLGERGWKLCVEGASLTYEVSAASCVFTLRHVRPLRGTHWAPPPADASHAEGP